MTKLRRTPAGGEGGPSAEDTAGRDLSGRVVVVSGASRGIGAALARACAAAGADVAICARGEEGLERVRRDVLATGRECLARPCDVRRFEEVAALARLVLERFGRADGLVCNAGALGPRVPLAELPVEAWRSVLQTNVDGTFHLVRAFVPAMLRAGRGSVVTVTSGVGNVGKPRWGAYGVSKFAQEGLALGLAAELEGTGVRSNLVDPGPTRTAMRAAAYPDEDPATLPEPERVTGVFLWLLSDAARDVNGRRFRAREAFEPPAAEPGARR